MAERQWNQGTGVLFEKDPRPFFCPRPTRFAYSDLVIDHPELTADGTVRFRFTVKNVGQRAGQEVAQVYFRDEVSSVTTPMKRLIRFEKIPLEPGESRVVEMEIDGNSFGLSSDRR